MQESKVAVQQGLKIAKRRRETICKRDRESYRKLNADLQRIARRDKSAFLNEQCKEIEKRIEREKLEICSDKLEVLKELFVQKWT